MEIKSILYIIITILTIWAIESLNISGIFKKNRYYQARVLYLIVSMALSYLVVNFLYDLFNYTKIM